MRDPHLSNEDVEAAKRNGPAPGRLVDVPRTHAFVDVGALLGGLPGTSPEP